MTMASRRPKKIGGACERVWAIADELAEQQGQMPGLAQIRERYSAEGGNPNTAATQFSLWISENQHWLSGDSPAQDKPRANATDVPVRLTVAADGRIVIPKEIRASMDLGENSEVTARLIDGELRLLSPRMALRRAQKALAPLKREGESIVDEFLAERRASWGEE